MALRVGNGAVQWLIGDQLGSTSVTAEAAGSRTGELWYKPYGASRSDWGATPTQCRFTGQILDSDINLYQMGARWYDPDLNQWIQPDTIIPDPGNAQALNRYSYCLNNPLNRVDPSGHAPMFPGQSAVAVAAVVAETFDPIPADPLVWALAAD